MSETKCNCGGKTLIFACSGAADVGAVADQAARKLTRDGVGGMFCLAGVGGRVEPILGITRESKSVLAIDGCPLNCAKNCLQEADVTEFVHLQLAELGMAKGDTPATEENIEKAAIAAKDKISG